jgi:hypothetical protein
VDRLLKEYLDLREKKEKSNEENCKLETQSFTLFAKYNNHSKTGRLRWANACHVGQVRNG